MILRRIEFSTQSGTDSSGVAAFQFNIHHVTIGNRIAYKAFLGKEDLQGVFWSIDSGANLTLTTLQAIQVGAPATPTVSACLELVYSAINGCGPVPVQVVAPLSILACGGTLPVGVRRFRRRGFSAC